MTGLMWKRYNTIRTGSVERVGIGSNGGLSWYDMATCYTLHPAAADLQMMTTGIKIVGGAAELPCYFAGMIIDPSGFANAVNNLPGYRVTSVAVNGADLDILLYTGHQTSIAEVAAGARDIRVVCRSIYAYAAGADVASFAGYTDWRIPDLVELISLQDWEAATAAPNSVYFPNWSTLYIWTGNTDPSNTANAQYLGFLAGNSVPALKTSVFGTVGCEIVRGGIPL